MTAAPAAPALRGDIQALRGWAVLGVILYHAGLGLAPGGFLGVDLFFVVSGYLIGGHVLRALADGSFGFAAFYLRRVRRLAPAAYAVLLASVLAAWALMTGDGHARFTAQALGALTYATNVVLWRQINYFNNSAVSEPLLHMWSLGIEEQFYLLLPLALWLLPRRARGGAVLLATATSLAAWLWLYPRSPGAAFYLLPCRAWELGLGVLTAIAATRGSGQRAARLLTGPAAALVLGPMLLTLPLPPHWLPVPVCLGTAVLLLADRALPCWLKPLARVGDASYSLYLVHWPLFAFAHVLWLGAPLPVEVSLALVGLSGALGAALYRWVERPGRWYPLRGGQVAAWYLAASLTLAVLALAGAAAVRGRGQPIDQAGVTGLALAACVNDGPRFDPRCASGPDPVMLVWGDSFAQQLVPALQAGQAPAFAQAAKGQCAPLPGLAPVDRDAPMGFAQDCLRFNAAVLAYARSTPSLRVVVLSGYYQRYAQAGTRALTADGAVRMVGQDDLVAVQSQLVVVLRGMGKRVVLVTGPEQARFDVGQCLVRQAQHLPMIAPAPQCRITAAGRAQTADWTNRLFARFEQQASTPVIRLDRLLCPDPAACDTSRGGVALYRDPNHLSWQGSTLVGRELGLVGRISVEAR